MTADLIGSILCVLLIPPVAHSSAIEQPGANTGDPSCGIQALDLMLGLVGRPRNLPALAASMPGIHPRGYSLSEIRDAADRLGLPLVGARIGDDGRPPDGPSVVLINREERHGHFVVVRPIGHTGKLVQVLDPVGDPEILDAARLYSSPGWTGLALVQRHRGISRRTLLGIAAGSVGAFLLAWSLVISRKTSPISVG